MNVMKEEAKVIAEIGCVHLGSMDRATKLIDLAKICGADYVKFQKRNPEESVPEALKSQPHPNQCFAYGPTYLEHRKALELSAEQHLVLRQYCSTVGMRYAVSVWDMTSTKEMIAIDPSFIKIPSACNHNRKLLDHLLQYYSGDIHISTGMSSKTEITDLINFLCVTDPKRFVLYHCTSIYPCPFEKLHLLDIDEFAKLKSRGLRIGFSNHGYGLAADIAAWVLGAEYIERHFVDDRTLKHTDAAASLEPDGLRRICRDLKAVRRAFTYSPTNPDDLEVAERNKLRVENELR